MNLKVHLHLQQSRAPLCILKAWYLSEGKSLCPLAFPPSIKGSLLDHNSVDICVCLHVQGQL